MVFLELPIPSEPRSLLGPPYRCGLFQQREEHRSTDPPFWNVWHLCAEFLVFPRTDLKDYLQKSYVITKFSVAQETAALQLLQWWNVKLGEDARWWTAAFSWTGGLYGQACWGALSLFVTKGSLPQPTMSVLYIPKNWNTRSYPVSDQPALNPPVPPVLCWREWPGLFPRRGVEQACEVRGKAGRNKCFTDLAGCRHWREILASECFV